MGEPGDQNNWIYSDVCVDLDMRKLGDLNDQEYGLLYKKPMKLVVVGSLLHLCYFRGDETSRGTVWMTVCCICVRLKIFLIEPGDIND